ncbi:M23 family metallopeptidase [candidate division KSB1 bacterium]
MSNHFRAVLFSHSSSSSKEFNFSRFQIVLISLFAFVCFASITSFLVVVVSDFLHGYRLDLLRQERGRINERLQELQTLSDDLQQKMEYFQQRDDELRIEISLDPADPYVREPGVGGSADNFTNTSEFYFTEQEFLADITAKLERLNTQVMLQEESFLDIENGIEDHKEWLRFYPGIPPVEGGRIQSGFGMRQDPVVALRNPNAPKDDDHQGIDISGLAIGTPIRATADGIVITVERRATAKGYGRYIEIHHESDQYEAITLYGHLSEVAGNLRINSVVKRGDIIGKLGKTGYSTGPHLHYGIKERDRNGNFRYIDPRLRHLSPHAYGR